MSKIMLYWQENWQMGMALSVIIGVSIYAIVSILVYFKARKLGHDICMLAFVPVVNLFVPVSCRIQNAIERKKLKQKSLENEIESEEIDLW